MRAALQIIAQARKRSEFALPYGSGGETRFSTLHNATEKPPRR
jgi:hypothetical protein